MKKLLIILFAFITTYQATAQLTGWVPYKSKNVLIGLAADSLFYLPIKDTTHIPQRIGAVTIRPQDSLLYRGIKTTAGGKHWAAFGEFYDSTLMASVKTLKDSAAAIRADFPAGGGNVVDGGSFSTSNNYLTITQSVGSDIGIRIPPSYLINPALADSIVKVINDSTVRIKAISVTAGNVIEVTATRNDSLNNYNVFLRQTFLDSIRNGNFGGGTTDSLVFATRKWRQKGDDSLAALIAGKVSGSGTDLQVALWNGSGVTGHQRYTYVNSNDYPSLIIGAGSGATYGASIQLRDIAGTYSAISVDGGPLSLYGSSTYNSVGIYPSAAAGQAARFYISGGTNRLIDFYGTVTTSDTVVYSITKGPFDISRSFLESYGGNAGHGFTDQTKFFTGNAAFNSFGSFVEFGNNTQTQDHYAAFQNVWKKSKANRITKVYGFVNAVSEITGGFITDLYGYYHYSPTITGGVIENQYGIYIPAMTGANKNRAAVFNDSITIADGTQGAGKVLTSDANGNASWQTASSAGDVVKLMEGSVSAATMDIDFSTYVADYDIIEVFFFNVIPATDAVTLNMRMASDGTTFSSGGSDYKFSVLKLDAAGIAQNGSSAASAISLTPTNHVGNGSSTALSGSFKIFSPNVATFKPMINGSLSIASYPEQVTFFGQRDNAQTLKGVQFLFSSGNISGNYKVIGYKTTP